MSMGEVSDIKNSGASILDQNSPDYITLRNRCEKQLRNDFKSFQDAILSTMESWFAKQDERQAKLLNEFEDIRKSLSFIHSKYEELNNKSDDLLNRVIVLEKKSVVDDQHIQVIKELEYKIDNMDQQARLPEKRGEDLMSIIFDIGVIVKQPITRQDIISVHRVPHADASNKRPKNVVVKLSNRILRDNFLSSVRMAKGVATDQLKISGAVQKIYINEHLTLKNKKLFRETRLTAKECGYKYTWIKHGIILVREKETSPVLAIRRTEDLRKILKK